MNAVVIDTNVLVVANERENSNDLSESCIEAAQKALMCIKSERVTLLDDLGLIWEEYSKYCTYKGEPGLGDAFFLWLFERQADVRYCRKVSLTENAEREFEQFPEDEDLKKFDRSDRKFVAVALAYEGSAWIYNAVDSDWWLFRNALEKRGLKVIFLCEKEVKAKAAGKA